MAGKPMGEKREMLPEGTKEVAGWADLNAYWATIERGEDGTVYFVTWAYGTPYVRCVVYPDGRSWADID